MGSDLLLNSSGLLDENGNFLPVNYKETRVFSNFVSPLVQGLETRHKDIQNYLKEYYQRSSKLNSADKKAVYLMRRLLDDEELGLTEAQAAGIAGNIWVESKFNPRATGDGGAAHGIAQWHPNRRKGINMLNTSFDDQVTYMINELKSKEKKALYALRKAQTPEQAAEIVDKLYERSDGATLKERKSKASEYFDMI
jgi:hypothetical protein